MLPAQDPAPSGESDESRTTGHLFCEFCRVFISVAEPRAVFEGRAYHRACAEKALVGSGR